VGTDDSCSIGPEGGAFSKPNPGVLWIVLRWGGGGGGYMDGGCGMMRGVTVGRWF